MLVHSKDMFFLFSQGSLHGIILDFGFLHIPNYVLGFSMNKGNSLCVFIPRGINGNWLIVCSLKIRQVLIFWWALPRYQIWSRVCFFADAHMANREWGPSMPIPPCNNREGGRARDCLSSCHYPVIIAYYYRPLTVKCIRVSYFLVTINMYIILDIWLVSE